MADPFVFVSGSTALAPAVRDGLKIAPQGHCTPDLTIRHGIPPPDVRGANAGRNRLFLEEQSTITGAIAMGNIRHVTSFLGIYRSSYSLRKFILGETADTYERTRQRKRETMFVMRTIAGHRPSSLRC